MSERPKPQLPGIPPEKLVEIETEITAESDQQIEIMLRGLDRHFGTHTADEVMEEMRRSPIKLSKAPPTVK